MARSIGSYTLQFGMVCIPVELHTAARSEDVSFNQLHAPCGSRVKQHLVCPVCDPEHAVDRAQLVKGYEVAKGQYVHITDADLSDLPLPSQHTISIAQFVEATEVDPIRFEKTYWLSPDKGGDRPMALLMAALEDKQRVAIATVTIRKREQRCVLRVHEGRLLMHPLWSEDELKLEAPLPRPAVSESERAMAGTLVDALTKPFDPQFTDQYQAALKRLIQAKLDGVVMAPVATQPVAPPADLASLLSLSVAAAQGKAA